MATYVVKHAKLVLAVNGNLQQLKEGDEISLNENVAKNLIAKGRIEAKAQKQPKEVGKKSK